MSNGHEIAQLTIARAVAPVEDPRMADFMGALDRINALAEASPGFVWRLQGENGNNTDFKVGGDPLVIVNLSIWRSIDELREFTYRSDHKELFARRFEWFERWPGPSLVVWSQLAGVRPTIDEALEKLDHLAMHGPTADAFTLKSAFPDPPGRAQPRRTP